MKVTRMPRIWLAIAALIGAFTAQAQPTFPTRPVRMVIAFTAASETDQLARTLGQKLSEQWGQPIVFDNRPGGGGVTASSVVAKAPPDGYTLLMTTSAHVVAPALHASLPYDALRDFDPITQVAGVPNVLIASQQLGVTSVAELIALAKQKPGQLTFGSAGIGSGMHINAEQFLLDADIKVTHVPYKGGPEALTDVLAGRLSFVFMPMGLVKPLLADKRIVALGVTTPARAAALPDVPSIAESGLPGFEYDGWYGLFAPAGTPQPVLQQIASDVARALASAEVKDKYALRGAVPKAGTPQQFDRFVREEAEKLKKLVNSAGLQKQ